MAEAPLDVISPESARTLSGLFRDRVERTPHKVAYRHFDQHTQRWIQITWAEMAHSVARWQAAFKRDGLLPGDRVAVMMRNCPDWVRFDQAALGLNLVVVPLYVNDRADNVAYILEDSGAKLLLFEGYEQWQVLKGIAGGLGRLERLLSVQPITATNAPNYRHLAAWLNGAESEMATFHGSPDELATIVYTSGTTGKPKGVMLSHRNIVWNAYAAQRSVPCYADDVFLSFLPLSHMLERTAGLYLPMMGGATVAYARSIPQLAEDLQAVRPTVIISVPRIFERVAIKVQTQLEQKGSVARRLFHTAVETGWHYFLYCQGRLSWRARFLLKPVLDRLVARKVQAKLGGRMRVAVCGGAPLSLPVAKLFLGLGVPLVQGYGLTETSPVIGVNKLEDNDPASIGPPLQDVEIRIAENGELLVRGPGVMLGYWQNEAATRDAVDEDGWLHTGDKAELRAGHIYITGRVKDIIVLANGEKVPPGDMEAAILLDPFFESVMVLGEGKPFLSALVVPSQEHWADFLRGLGRDAQDSSVVSDPQVQEQVLARLARRLHDFPGYAQVRKVTLSLEPWTVDNGLMTPTLKLRRSALMERFQDQIRNLYDGH